jgi:hypothetical protein
MLPTILGLAIGCYINWVDGWFCDDSTLLGRLIFIFIVGVLVGGLVIR